MLPLPDHTGNRIKLTQSGYLKAFAAAILIIGALVLYTFELRHFDKMLNVRYFVGISLVIGMLLGALLGRKYAAEEDDLVDKMRIYMICGALSVFFMPLLISLLNRLGDFRTPQYEPAELLTLGARADQPFGHVKGEQVKVTHYEISILVDRQIFKFSTRTSPFPENKVGDQLEVPVYRGLLGIRYLKF